MTITVKKEIEETVEVKLPLFVKNSEDSYTAYFPNKVITVYNFAVAPLVCVNLNPLGLSDAVGSAIGLTEVSEDVFFEALSATTSRIKELAQTEIAA